MVSKTTMRMEDSELNNIHKYFFKVILKYELANLTTSSNVTVCFTFANLKISFSVRMQVVK